MPTSPREGGVHSISIGYRHWPNAKAGLFAAILPANMAEASHRIMRHRRRLTAAGDANSVVNTGHIRRLSIRHAGGIKSQ
jgi:hypothetical protein